MIPYHRGTVNVKKKERMVPSGLLEGSLRMISPCSKRSLTQKGYEICLSNTGETEKEGPEGVEPSIIQEPAPRLSILYQPSKSSNLPFPSRLKKQKKDGKDERLLSIFKQIHFKLPFLEAMIHMPKGAKVLKDLLSHKEKLKKAASSVKLSEVRSAIIQRRLPQKEGDPGSFTLLCLIEHLAVKNALADLGASLNLMPYSIF
ncbi:hypothetical protein Tco_1276117 [Tanacetum coccineum]